MKFRYKLLIVLAVFIAALIFFGEKINETIFSSSATTTLMSEATLPTISFDVDGNVVNRLHGYVSNLNEMLMRESITPLTSARNFTVLIEENESNVKKLKYEIFNTDGRAVEEDSFTVLDVEDGPKKVDIALKETMKSGQEYICKITLITNKSKRIYYYTRLKMYDDGHLFEKLEFVDHFSKTMLGGKRTEQEELKKYLESTKSSDNTTFAKVNIKSSFDMVTWGDLEPEVVWSELPTVTEFYDSMASIELKYLVSVKNDGGKEYYIVKEHFRFNYTTRRVYLYNYERTMDEVFDPSNTSLTKNEFKLGITNDKDAQTGSSASGKYLSFVYGRELMLYDVEKNELHKVFGFKTGNGDYTRDYYDQHDVKLIYVHDNGNADFMVYGYMNRGEYEGRVGIVLYRYIHEENRIEEKLYIPINASYQLLAADVTDFTYLGEKDVFYFSLYEAIYSYDLTTKKLSVIAEGVPAEKLVYCESEHYIAWQENADDTASKAVHILNLSTGEAHAVTAPYGETVRLYGGINDNIIYGFARDTDVSILADGSRTLPAYKLCIEDGYGNVLKEYSESGFYISDISIGDNILMLQRVKRRLGDDVLYEAASEDSIMNRHVDIVKPVYINKRVTERVLTEYYVALPSSVDIEEQPVVVNALNTIINYDTTTRVSQPEGKQERFYTYSFGSIVLNTPFAAEAVKTADASIGTVIDSSGHVIWERGVKSPRAEIAGLRTVNADEEHTSLQAAMKMLLINKNYENDTRSFSARNTGIARWLTNVAKFKALDLSGATLDEVLYYVYKSRPVIAILPGGSACVITGYDASSVTVFEPAKKKSVKYALKDAVTMFENAGNMFVSYVD